MREVIVNCETGEVTERDLTAEEIAARKAEADRETERQAAAEAAAAKKAAILAALADATGYTPDELREALNA